MAVKKHHPGQFLLHYLLSSVHVILKWIITPVLHIAVQMSMSSRIANLIDEHLNRFVLPLTEKPSDSWRRDTVISLEKESLIHDHVLRDASGKSFKMKSLIVGNWSAVLLIRGAWCSYSRMHMSHMQEQYDRFRSDKIRIIGITIRLTPDWWEKDGIEFPIYEDQEGSLFTGLGIRQKSWTDKAWGRLVPFEGVLLFNPTGNMFDFDLRAISGIRTGQEFLSARQILARFSKERSGYAEIPH